MCVRAIGTRCGISEKKAVKPRVDLRRAGQHRGNSGNDYAIPELQVRLLLLHTIKDFYDRLIDLVCVIQALEHSRNAGAIELTLAITLVIALAKIQLFAHSSITNAARMSTISSDSKSDEPRIVSRVSLK